MKVVLVCCVVHNHIMGVEPNDHIMEDAMNQVESSDHQQEIQSRRESIKDSRSWKKHFARVWSVEETFSSVECRTILVFPNLSESSVSMFCGS